MKNLLKKVAKFITKHDNIFVLIFITIAMLAKVYNSYLNSGDESYNFINCYKLANGLTIYKDNNVIITPLFFYIASIFLKIFGENILVYRTYNLIISVFTFFLCYIILKELKINKRFSLLYTLLITALTSSIVGGGANYNVLAYGFYLLGFYLILKLPKGNVKSIIQGIMIFIVFLTYQKLGAAYFIAIIAYEIINKDIKSLFKELLTAFILLIAFLMCLYINKNLYDFINYVILGMNEFGSKNWAIEGNIFSILLFLLIPVLTLVSTIIISKAIKSKLDLKNKQDIIKKMYIIFAFAICTYIIIIPIVNIYHVYLASILILINLMYIIHFLIKPIIEEESIKTIINSIILCIIIVFLISNLKGIYEYISLAKYTSKESPFYGAIINPELDETIKNVSEYIQNNDKDTIVLSTYAPLISLYLNDLDNKDFDLPLRGNLGKDGEEGLIEKIKNLNNTQILLLHETEDEKELYQFAYDVSDYIRQNYQYIGQIDKFDIYEIN